MIFKKLALAAVIISAATITNASDFYVKPMIGRLQPGKMSGMKAKPVILPGFAIGYNLKDNMRVDLSLEHLSNIKHTTVLKDKCPQDDSNMGLISENQVCVHSKITTIKVNLFVDVLKVNESIIYTGLGIGRSQIGGYVTVGETVCVMQKKYSVAYAFYAGLSHRVQDNIVLEAGYGYKHFNEDIYNHKGHLVSTALRIEL